MTIKLGALPDDKSLRIHHVCDRCRSAFRNHTDNTSKLAMTRGGWLVTSNARDLCATCTSAVEDFLRAATEKEERHA